MWKPTEDPWIPDENPALPGPDYVALVIEWDDVEEPQISEVTQRIVRMPRALLQVTGVVLGAIGALALGVWGVHRLRTA